MSQAILVKFAPHVSEEQQRGVVAELAELHSVLSTRLGSHHVELHGFRKSRSNAIVEYLAVERNRGTLEFVNA